MTSLPSPSATTTDTAETFVTYLDFLRTEVRRKTADLDKSALVTSLVVSGWTPTQLVTHLVHMERRWLVWGFLAEQVEHPWGDQDDSGRWVTQSSLDELLSALDAGGLRTAEIVAAHGLLDHAATGGRFPAGEPTPTLLAILFHVMQEYARHVGHLDIVRELIDGQTGED